MERRTAVLTASRLRLIRLMARPRFFRTSVNRTYTLSSNAKKARNRIYKILGHNNTRWNSKLHSMESVLRMEDAIRDCSQMFIADHVEPLSENDWASLKAVSCDANGR